MKSSILKHPLTILSGVAIGVLVGLFNTPISNALKVSNFAQVISFPGQLYLYFLQMTVIPIIIAAISSSLGKLMRNKSSVGLIKKIVVVFVLCMFVCALVGMAVGMIGKPGSGLNEDTRILLSKLLAQEQDNSDILEVALGSGEDIIFTVQRPGMSYFFANMIPANIFQALSLGSVMAILFFSIIFGIAIGVLPEESALLLINLCTAIFQAFQKLINWSLYLLPIGLICLLAGQIAAVGVQIFTAMSKFIILYCVGTVVIFAVCTVIIWIRSKVSNPFKVISILFEPILLAFATRNSMATLPSAINCLDNELKFNSNSVNLTLPLGMTLGRFGNIFYFALGVFFVAQIYGTPLGPVHYIIILVGVIFAGTATSGASGIVTLSMLSIVLEPLSLPMEAVLIIFMAIDPIIDPLRTFLIVYVNMAATALIAEREDEAGEGEIFALEAAIKKAEDRIQRSARAKLAGTATLDDEKVFRDINAEINRLREKKKQLLERSQHPDANSNQLLVYVQEIQNRPPILQRSEGSLDGMEISLLKEIGRRMNRQIILYDSMSIRQEEREGIMKKADIIAGIIIRTTMPPIKDFFFSHSWATVTDDGLKKPVCFLLLERSPHAVEINNIVKNLIEENYIKSLFETVKSKQRN